MASGDARPMPQKNVAYRVTFPLFSNTGTLVTGAAGLDSEVSKDAGTFADCTNEATEIATSSGMYYLDLTSTEMNADTVTIIVKTSTTDARTTPIILYPEEAGDVRVNVTQISGDGTAADNAEAFFDGTGYAGTNNVIPLVTTTTTATNLTNAPTAGDFTATMKTSISTAATSSLNSYDPPTRAELTSDVSTLATAANLTTLTGKVDVIDGIVDSILVDTAEIGAAGAGLTALASAANLATVDSNVDAILVDTGTTVPAQISALNNISTAQVNAEVDTALADIHLDHLLAADYDPASKPGVSTALLNEMVGNDGGVSQFTANALELAPSGTGASAASIVAAMFTTNTGETEASAVAGSAVYEIVQNAGGGSAPSAADIRAEIDSNSTQLAAIVADTNELQADWVNGGRLDTILDARASQTSVDDVPTNSELTTALSGLATASALATVDGNVDDILTDTGTTIPAQISALNNISTAQVNAEVDSALADYDGPTNTEMVARTLPAADYATSANLATVDTVVDTIAAGLIVVDGLVDTLIAQLTGSRGEPSPGAPPASASLGVKVDWLYAITRNGESVTASLQTIYADDGTTPLTKATVADNGTTFTRAELVAP